MYDTTTQEQPSAGEDRYRGAQQDLVFRGSGVMSILGAVVSLTLMVFYPPTVALGGVGWALAVPAAVLSIGLGTLSVTLKHRPSINSVYASAFIGIAQIGFVQWLAGGGKAPYIQMLMLPMLGSGLGQSVRRCVPVVIPASIVAFSPLLYSSIDAPATATEFTLMSVMTLLIAAILATTREHRARLLDAGEHANVLAHVDPLTGMPNRRAFDAALSQLVESPEHDRAPIALLLCDVNSFKQVNDKFGHAAGDEALRSIGQALSDAVRKPDSAFRWAGDEFAVILRDSDAQGAALVAARIREAVSRRCRRPDGEEITIGTGFAELKPGMSSEEVLVEADRALFCHKAERSRLASVA